MRWERTSRRSGDGLEAVKVGEDGDTERDESGDTEDVSGTSEESVKDSDPDGSQVYVPEAEDFFEGEESVRAERVEEIRFVDDGGPAVSSSSRRVPSSAECRHVSVSMTALRTALQTMPGQSTVLNLCTMTSLTPHSK